MKQPQHPQHHHTHHHHQHQHHHLQPQPQLQPPKRWVCFSVSEMKVWLGAGIVFFVFMVLFIRFELMHGSFIETYTGLITDRDRGQNPSLSPHNGGPLHVGVESRELVIEPVKRIGLMKEPSVIKLALAMVNASAEESAILSVWQYMSPILSRPDNFPELKQALKEAKNNWIEFGKTYHSSQGLEDEHHHRSSLATNKTMEKQCPYSVSSINRTLEKGIRGIYEELEIPCGLVVDSAITIVAVPWGAEGSFAIELLGPTLPGDVNPPIILHYNVRLLGDKLTNDAVIVQNTWSREREWGDEERCPVPDASPKKVDGLDACSEQLGKASIRMFPGNLTEAEKQHLLSSGDTKHWFPFINGLPFAATLWVGWEGFHMTVNGKHVTSFEYRENLKPSLVGSIRLKGSVKTISILATGLPASEDVTHADLEFLKAPPFRPKQQNKLFIGVFSTGNNFDRRMAVRRTWMQYESVRSGNVTVRFFVGQHSNMQVNKEIWREALTYGDIQLMPFVDLYNLITLKTIAICIFGTEIMRSKYIMKTDDDTFVRVDEILSLLSKTKKSKGLLYGSIEFESEPHREVDDKWYISTEEWPHASYPPWAHGPGYIISNDIASFVVRSHYNASLKLFKLEDVSMGVWIETYKNHHHEVHYIHNQNFNNIGCSDGYVIAHYQNPRHMACLWGKLRDGEGPVCCNDR